MELSGFAGKGQLWSNGGYKLIFVIYVQVKNDYNVIEANIFCRTRRSMQFI